MIIAIGDSLTRGTIGHSYLKYMSARVINKGVNGDCILGLYARLTKLLADPAYDNVDTFIVEIGTNDVFLPQLWRISGFWRANSALRQRLFGYHYCIEDEEFLQVYQDIIAMLKERDKRIILVGLPKTEFKDQELGTLNSLLSGRNELIKSIAKAHGLKFVDTYSLIDGFAPNVPDSGYRWGSLNLMRLVDGFFFAIIPALKDFSTKRRNLNFTVDGIHFNSATAKALAKEMDSALDI